MLTTRRALFLFLLVVLIGCGHGRAPEVFCNRGNASPSRPLICVDERTLRPSPYEAVVFDVEAENGERTNRPVIVQWVSRRGANLGIEFREKGCVEDLQCIRGGHCSARVLPTTTRKTCEYWLNLDGRVLDPPLVITPCCMAQTTDMETFR
jgi:hypothetical protein